MSGTPPTSTPPAPRLQLEPGSLYAAIAIALKRGVPIASMIDLGSADGLFSLTARMMAPLARTEILNIDAQTVYEPSLRRIQRALGGHYRICAVSDRAATVALTTASHPYWSSLRPPSDGYWRQHEGAAPETIAVPAYRLDDIVAEVKLPPPHLIKLDIQGSELAALAGAPRSLAAANLVVVETFVGEFPDIHRLLTEADFALFDLTLLNRGPDHSLSWFYPIYAHRRLNLVTARPLWSPEVAEQVIANQATRRAAQLRELDAILGPLETGRRSGTADDRGGG
jgi:FkbM family methyltransferase